LSSVVHRLSVALADEEEAAAIAESLRTTAEAVGDQTEADHATHNHAMVRAACRVLESELPVAFREQAALSGAATVLDISVERILEALVTAEKPSICPRPPSEPFQEVWGKPSQRP
jgi:hypothetical protein